MRLLPVVVCALLVGCGREKPPELEQEAATEKAPPVFVMPTAEIATSAGKLYDEYSSNALAADGKYKDKWIEVKANAGKIWSEGDEYRIGLATFESIAVPVKDIARMTEQQKTWFREGYPPHVIGVIHPDAYKDFAALKPNQAVTVIAKGAGLLKGLNVPKGYGVLLTDCRLIEAIERPPPKVVPKSALPKKKKPG